MRSQLRVLGLLVAATSTLALVVALTTAQPGSGDKTASATDFVKQMMTFDKDKDGKLSKDEVYDRRLHSLHERMDTNKDASVTQAEMEAFFTRETATFGVGGDFGFFGAKGFGGKKGPKGPGFPRPPGGRGVEKIPDPKKAT